MAGEPIRTGRLEQRANPSWFCRRTDSVVRGADGACRVVEGVPVFLRDARPALAIGDVRIATMTAPSRAWLVWLRLRNRLRRRR